MLIQFGNSSCIIISCIGRYMLNRSFFICSILLFSLFLLLFCLFSRLCDCVYLFRVQFSSYFLTLLLFPPFWILFIPSHARFSCLYHIFFFGLLNFLDFFTFFRFFFIPCLRRLPFFLNFLSCLFLNRFKSCSSLVTFFSLSLFKNFPISKCLHALISLIQ